MIKLEYIVGAALVLMWMRGTKKAQQSTQLQDSMPLEGGNWQDMGDMWSRLNGQGMSASGYPNLASGPVADPGKVGILNAGLMPSWNGSL